MGESLPGTRSEAGSEQRRVRELVVVFSPDGHVPPPLALEHGPLRIGRDRDAALPLEDDEVSRSHAEVRYDEDMERWLISDSGSRNGLWVNARRVERAALAHGTVVRLGRTLLVMVDVLVAADRSLRQETRALRGHSLAMQQVRGEIAAMAGQRIPLLVLGETGVGKELVARDLHERSGRPGPFVPVHCATIPSGIQDSELFGQAAGPLAKVVASHDGLFGRARGGTLFLDGIGELPAAVQPKLSRALAAGTIPPVGQAASAQVDVQVIATAHRDLVEDVANGGFESDLYSRLAGRVLHVPPLRERREDILDLAQTVLDRWHAAAALGPTGRAHGGKLTLSDGAAEALLLYDWPFNVRELEHAIERAAVRAESDIVIRCQYLPPSIGVHARSRQVLQIPPVRSGALAHGTVPSEAELRKLLVEHGGNVLHAARALRKDRQQLYRWFKRYAIDVAAIRSEHRTGD